MRANSGVPENKKRLIWIDNLKAVGIIFVVFAHNHIDPHIVQYIYAFHMPLFFFLSGVLYNGNKYDFREYFDRKILTRIKPYFILSFITYSFWMMVVIPLSVRGGAHQVDKFKAFLGIFYGIGTGVWANQMAVALWFLPCLFCVEVIYYFLCKKSGDSKFRAFVYVSLVVLVGCLMSMFKMPPWRIPWSCDVALIAVSFYAGGHLLANYWNKIQEQKFSILKYLAAILVIVFGVMLSKWNGRIDMSSSQFHNPLLFVFTPFCFFVPLIFIFRNIKVPGFSFLGQNTLPILAYHFIALFIIRSVLYLFTRNPQPFNALTITENILLVVMEFLVLYPIILAHNKYLGRVIA